MEWSREFSSYVEDEGPNNGFSLRGWKESLPKNLGMHLLGVPEFLGQSLTTIVTKNTTTLAATKRGTIHDLRFLESGNSMYGMAVGGAVDSFSSPVIG